MAIINTDYLGTLEELARRLILIVDDVYVQVHKCDLVREVRLYVTVGLLDISVFSGGSRPSDKGRARSSRP